MAALRDRAILVLIAKLLGCHGKPPAGLMTSLPRAGEAERITAVLHDHPGWSAFWDKRHGVWRVAEDDPGSGLYAESTDADTVIGYIKAHS